MKRFSVLMLAGLLLAGPALAGVVKKSKSEITFKQFGTFTTVIAEKVASDLKSTDMENTFKGKGLISNLAGKTLLRSGSFGEIVDLPQMTITSLDHKQRVYQVRPIEPVSQETGQRPASGKETQQEKPEESDIRVIRSEFKVEKTGESKVINQFSCEKYLVTWLMEWENTKTKQKGTDRLATDVWTTALTADLKAGQQEELAFSRQYMKKIGLETDALQKDVLGTAWLEILSGLDPASGKPRLSTEKTAAEMKKIQGYPVVVDGKYYSTTEGGTAPAEEESGGGLLGRLARKVVDQKPKADASEPVLAYYTELVEIRPANLAAADFQVPAGYKKRD